MGMVVRDEGDILPQNIEFHRKKGVEIFLVVDHRSEDGIEDYLRGQPDVIWERKEEEGYYQGEWVTEMARRAKDLKADFFIPGDADEFWCSKASLKDELTSFRGDFGRAWRRNILPDVGIVGDGYRFFHNRQQVVNPFDRIDPKSRGVCDSRSFFLHKSLPKYASRLSCFREARIGNHEPTGPGVEGELGGIVIAHYALRSWENFRNKVRFSGPALEKNPGLSADSGWHWRRWWGLQQAGLLKREYEERLLLGGSGLEELHRQGRIKQELMEEVCQN